MFAVHDGFTTGPSQLFFSWGLQDYVSMPENRTCSLSIVQGSYNGVNLKYNLWSRKG